MKSLIFFFSIFHTGLWCCSTCFYPWYNYELSWQVWHSCGRAWIEGKTRSCFVQNQVLICCSIYSSSAYLKNCGLGLFAVKWWWETTCVNCSCILEGAFYSVSFSHAFVFQFCLRNCLIEGCQYLSRKRKSLRLDAYILKVVSMAILGSTSSVVLSAVSGCKIGLNHHNTIGYIFIS